MTTLIIARHGNTFESGETPRRVGVRTDLPLTEKGRAQGAALGKYLEDNNLVPDVTYSSTLRRTKETAEIALRKVGQSVVVNELGIFNEIDYGPDENKTEEEVVARIGKTAIKNWDEKAIVPWGWNVEPEQIIENWRSFAGQIATLDEYKVFMVVTSNGIARFAPHLADNFESFADKNKIKISTGALCIFKHDGNVWKIDGWNIRPELP
jgi:probable phosphoglycerate mutase